MRAFEKIAYGIFRKSAERSVSRHPQIKASIGRARLGLRADVYLSKMYFGCLITAAASLAVSGALVYFSWGTPNFYRMLSLAAALPLILTGIMYAYGGFYPENRAKEMQKNIDIHLPYSLSYLSAISSAGIAPAEMFRALARHMDVYGEVAAEASRIYRDISIFGKDILDALKSSAESSPSLRYREVIEGLVATISSGGNIRQYLLAKSEQYIEENRRMQKGFLDTLGVFAESYAVVGVAFPLFLMIILSVMLFISTSSMSTSPLLLYVVVFLMFPLISGVFAWIIKGIMPEV